MAKIELLDKSVYELIAAGEVIERPASVIKELAENSIDAGAKHITVEIMNGGSSFMRVTDDGCGIPHDELPTAFMRHATSKVKTKNDLDSIFTLGFRGEALASVAAVSRVEVLTKEADEPLGSRFVISGGETEAHERAGCPDGTTVIIRDLFYNVPARRKFLKKDVSEGNQVQGLIDKLALANPGICFRFIRDNKQVRSTGGDGNYYSAVYSVFGKQFASSLISVDYESAGVSVTGYISSPLFARANRAMQYFFVNGRSIRSPICMAALEEGYRNSIMTGKFPACILNISVSPELCDVNVSPSKTEVRFAQEKLIFDAVLFAVKNAILNADNRRDIHLERKEIPAPPEKTDPQAILLDKARQAMESSPAEAYKEKIAESLEETRVVKPKERLYFNSPVTPLTVVRPQAAFAQQRLEEAPPAPEKEAHAPAETGFRYISESSLVKKEQPAVLLTDEPEKPRIRVVGELFATYIVCQCGEDMILIDKHAADERIRFEKKKKELTTASQLLAESEQIALTPEQYTALDEHADLLADIGVEVILSGGTRGEITAAPAAFAGEAVSPSAIVMKAAELLCAGNENLIDEIYDDLLHTRACKSAVKAHDVNDTAELRAIAEEVWSNEKIRFCPHGRPVMVKLSKRELEKYFSRIV